MAHPILGIAGGGQLGLMLTQAAHKLGMQVAILDPTSQSPAARVADRHIVGDFTDPQALNALADVVGLMTFEIESAHAGALAEIAVRKGDAVHPLPQTLSLIHDKLRQKELLVQAGIPVVPFAAVTTKASVEAVAERLGYPLVLKTRSGGYDGRGNALIREAADISPALRKFAGQKLYVEQFVPFTKELAVVAARTREGVVVTYPVVQTIHQDHICHMVIAPAPVPAKVTRTASRLAEKVLGVFGGAGVFGIEMFLTKKGDVLINEIAPRVHNSGHFTIEGCKTSQFEQHVRAVAGLPLGPVTMRFPAVVMINILGNRTGPARPRGMKKAKALGNVAVHIYGKKETRPQRKMGHITVWDKTVKEAVALAERAHACVSI